MSVPQAVAVCHLDPHHWGLVGNPSSVNAASVAALTLVATRLLPPWLPTVYLGWRRRSRGPSVDVLRPQHRVPVWLWALAPAVLHVAVNGTLVVLYFLGLA